MDNAESNENAEAKEGTKATDSAGNTENNERASSSSAERAGSTTDNDTEYTEEILDIIDERRVSENITVPPIVMEDVAVIHNIEDSPIRMKTENIKFPLTKEDKTDLVKLVLRFEQQEHLAGLSAPQIGINKRAFVFEIKKDPDDENEQTFPKSLWLNPTYRNADGATLDEDYESCISIKSSEQTVAVGPVFRFNRIFYRTYEADGRILEGEASGFAARVIQHEIDHLDGKLYADYVQPERLLSLPEYANKLEAGTLGELQTGVVPEFL